MTTIETANRLAEVVHKLQGALIELKRDGMITEGATWLEIYEKVDLACWVFGHAATDEERRAELRAVVEAATKIGTINDDAADAARSER